MWICSFVRKHPFWRSLAKKKNCQFKLKFGKKTKSNMQNSMVMFPFSVFDPFRVNLNNIIKNDSLRWNIVLTLILICTTVMLTFSVFDRQYLCWVNLVQKIKIANLSWYLVPRLICICIIQCNVHFFSRPKIHFLGKFDQFQNYKFNSKFGAYNHSQNIWDLL